MIFLLNTCVREWFPDPESADEIGKYFLWLEEKTEREWDDASSVIVAYASGIRNEDALEPFKIFIAAYEDTIEQEIEMKPALMLYQAQQTFPYSNGEMEDISLED